MGKKYYFIGCHVLWREICYYASISNNIFNIKFLRQGLHNTPDILREELQKSIDEIDGEYCGSQPQGTTESKLQKSIEEVDGECPIILIGYGLCSNGIVGITSKRSKLVFIKGHDCITFFLGSRERYRRYFDSHPGTYWYSPGWIETSLQPGKQRYDQTLQMYINEYGQENAEYLMKMEQGWFSEYTNAAYVDLGFCDGTKYKEYTKECARWLGWNYDELKGDSTLIRDFVEGNWNSDDFLVLEPGQKVVASHDEYVITSNNREDLI